MDDEQLEKIVERAQQAFALLRDRSEIAMDLQRLMDQKQSKGPSLPIFREHDSVEEHFQFLCESVTRCRTLQHRGQLQGKDMEFAVAQLKQATEQVNSFVAHVLPESRLSFLKERLERG